MFDYILDKFRVKSKFINDIDGVEEYLDSQALLPDEKAAILRKVYEYNKEVYALLLEENKKMEKIISSKGNKKILKALPLASVITESVEETSICKKEISFYIHQIQKCESLDGLLDILPKVTDADYMDTINCILLYLIEELFIIKKLLYEDRHNNDIEGRRFLESEYQMLKYKIDYIKNNTKNITKKKVIESNEPKNKLVFLKTNYGNVCAISDLKDICCEYYDQFSELLESIENGTFKSVKTFTNNNVLKDLSEVRGDGTRIIFDRVSKNIYVIIYMFIKRTDRNAAYIAALQNRSDLYHSNMDSIKQLSETSDAYLTENESILKDINRMLSKRTKTKIKGDNNE